MEGCGQLDVARLACAIALIALFGLPLLAEEITLPALFEQQRWDALVLATEGTALQGVDGHYYRGAALARLSRWDEARLVLLAGRRLNPLDGRFPIELAGVAFKRRQYDETAEWLREALRVDPTNEYANDFLATVYFLQGNLRAALKHWNRNAKPQTAQLLLPAGLKADPVILDGAFSFRPPGVLSLDDYDTTMKRVNALGIFVAPRIRLDARDDGKFDAVFTGHERNGFGGPARFALSALRGLFYQAVQPQYFNSARSTINIDSLFRWDTQKRRVGIGVNGPLKDHPGVRYSLFADGRNENWTLRSTARQSAAVLGSLNLRRTALGGEVISIGGPDWGWSAGAELSHREYRNQISDPSFAAAPLAAGYQLKHVVRIHRRLVDVPDARFHSESFVVSEAARIWSRPSRAFERLQVGVDSRWYPRKQGADYAMRQQIRAGGIFGQAPLDERYVIGIERDTGILLRAHPGTHDGRKGSAPLARRYFIANWEMDKILFNNGLLGVSLSPFLDTGTAGGVLQTGTRRWLTDVGIQVKLQVAGVGFLLVVGKDLRTGTTSIYGLAEP